MAICRLLEYSRAAGGGWGGSIKLFTCKDADYIGTIQHGELLVLVS